MAAPHAHLAPTAAAGPPSPPQRPPASSGGTNPLDAIPGAWAGLVAGAVNVAQAVLGAGLLGVAVLILVSQTSAGRSTGQAALGGARRAARLIPGVGVLT